MPFSGNDFVHESVKYVKSNYKKGCKILDIGAGAGKFGEHFSKDYKIDGVEIYEPYISEFNLEAKYNKLFNCNCLDLSLSTISDYDLIFMWKTLEHLSYVESRELISNVKKANVDFIFSVPYMTPQGVCHNNEFEIHKQDDLTLKIVKQRYPEFKTLFTSDHHGVFFWES